MSGKKLKINYCITYMGDSGGPMTIYKVASELAGRGHEVTLTTYGASSVNMGSGVRIIRPPAMLSLALSAFFKFADSVARIAFRKRTHFQQSMKAKLMTMMVPDCDINVATDFMSVFPVVNSKKGVPFYHMQHYEVLFCVDEGIRRLADSTYRKKINMIANSTWLHDEIKKRYGKESVVINPGFFSEHFYPRGAGGERSVRKIVTYSSGIEWKGFKDASDAMEIVFSRTKNIGWVVYGHRPSGYVSEKAPYEVLKGLSYDDLAGLYSSADVVLCPSWYESFPWPPLEAMACGAAVVTTSGGVEDYARDGENALVVPPRDPAKMADAVLRLLDDKELSGKIRKNALETVKMFTWERTVNKIESVFLSALNERLT